MSQSNAFDQLRLRLLMDVSNLDLSQPLPESFTRDFLKLIEMAVFSLMHKEDNFFGSCMIQMKRGIKFDLPTAAGVTADTSYFNMYFNPLILLKCPLEEVRGTIKHQIYHIMFRHLERAQKLKDQLSPLALNTGMDLAINQFIDCLPQGEITLDEAQEKYGVQLQNDQPFEVYCRLLQQAMDRKDNHRGEPEKDQEEESSSNDSPKESPEVSPEKSQEQDFSEEAQEDVQEENGKDSPRGEFQEESEEEYSEEALEEPGEDFPGKEPQEGTRDLSPGSSQEVTREEIEDCQGRGDSNLQMEEVVPDNISSSKAEIAHREENCHDIWEESNGEENLENVKEMTRKMANQANRGEIPAGLEEVIRELNRRPQVKWQDILRKTVGTLPVPYKKTITRKDRRQPERLDLRGRLSNRVVQVIIALDTSASMGESELQQGLAEIFSILKLYRHEVTVIECGNKIEKVYTARSPRDIQINLKGRGGTAFSPVFEYISQKQLRNHLLIYFTDGYGEEKLTIKPVNYRTLWVLTGPGNKLSLKKPYGRIESLKARG